MEIDYGWMPGDSDAGGFCSNGWMPGDSDAGGFCSIVAMQARRFVYNWTPVESETGGLCSMEFRARIEMRQEWGL